MKLKVAALVVAGTLILGSAIAYGTIENTVFSSGAIGEGTKLGEGELVATINDVAVNMSMFCVYLWSAQNSFETEYGLDISSKVDGHKVSDIAKENAINSIAMAIMANNKAAALGITLSEEQVRLIERDAQIFMNNNGEVAKANNFKKQDVIELLTALEIVVDVQNAIAEEYTPPAEEIATKVERNLGAYQTVTVKHILLAKTDKDGNELSDKIKAEKLSLAKNLLQRVKDGEDIGRLAAQYSEDATDDDAKYIISPGDIGGKLERVAFQTADGGIWNEVIESPYGYHVGKTISHNTSTAEQLSKTYIATAKKVYAAEVVTQFADQATVELTDAYDAIVL